MLSLVFVPAMFMMMDDFGALIWRFSKGFIVSHGESEPSSGHGDHTNPPTPPGIAPPSAAE
jgi:hypothetical protein